jgi:serine/threonine protein kinase
MINHKYKVLEKIGEGSFSSVYKGEFIKNDNVVSIAIKFNLSSLKNEYNELKHEAIILNYLNSNGSDKNGVPKIFWFGNTTYPFTNTNITTPVPCLILPYYKYTLKQFFHIKCKEEKEKEENKEHFFLKRLQTINKIFIKMLDILKYIHNQNIIHRDIKLCNFMIDDETEKVTLIDFGFATTFIDVLTNSHINYSVKKGAIIGSPVFISVNVHQGIEPTRRDDCISVCYIYMWFLFGGSLLWEGTHTNNEKQMRKEWMQILEQFQDFYNKNSTHLLLNDCNPDVIFLKKIIKYIKYFYELKFDETPVYTIGEP